MNFGGEGVVADRRGLNILSIYSSGGTLASTLWKANRATNNINVYCNGQISLKLNSNVTTFNGKAIIAH